MLYPENWQAIWRIIMPNPPFCAINKPDKADSVDLNLKNGVYCCLSTAEIKNTFWCSLLSALTSKYKKTIGSHTAWGASAICHNYTLKNHKTVFIAWSWDFFIPEVSCSVLSVGMLSVFSWQLCLAFYCVKAWCMAWEWHGLLDCRGWGGGGGASFQRVNCTP